MNTAFLSGVVFASLIPALAMVDGKPSLATNGNECENVHAHEPLVIYEVAGATLSGQMDRTLIVYGDGTLKLSNAAPGELGTAETVKVGPDIAEKRRETLVMAGAFKMCDDSLLAIDMPLHTVTLLGGSHEMRGRTFSYWNVEHGYAEVDALLEAFIADQFPN